MDKKEDKRKGKGKYWYYFYEEECVLCGRFHIDKERRPMPKPKDYNDRHHFKQYACDNHF
jgi:hypothetical protein